MVFASAGGRRLFTRKTRPGAKGGIPAYMTNTDLLKITDFGIYCPEGDFFIDPWQPVAKAVITHGHGDHAVGGCRSYLTSPATGEILNLRLGQDTPIQVLPYGDTVSLNGTALSLHPAGHILGSCQVRVEHRGWIWVVSGDYKTCPDPTCEPFEPRRCHTFITESTCGGA